ncbi:MAG: hypothetical protein RR949_01970 [Oscillospiraceae bacterium]
MSKFCKFCGTQLEEGAVCACPQAQAEAAAPQASSAAAPQTPPAAPRASASSAFSGLIPCLKAYFSAPVQTTRIALQRGDHTNAIMFLAVQLIVAGFLLFSVMQKVCNIFRDGIIEGVSNYGGMSMGNMRVPMIKAPLGGALLYGILMAAVAVALCILAVFIISKIAHSSATLKDVVIACGINSPVVTALLLVAALLCFVSLPAGIVVYSVAMTAWGVMTMLSAQSLVQGQDNIVFWVCCILGIALVGFLAVLIATKLFMIPALGGIAMTVDGETYKLKEALDMIGDLPDFDTMIQMIIEELI